jgi:LuxR family maltose regulon positive regulatory protein
VIARPGLFERLDGAARVVAVSAPAGSGKTFLLRSWVREADRAESVAWVSVGSEEHDPQRFWISLLDALRRTAPGSALVRRYTAAPDPDGEGIVERLLEDTAALDRRVWLVIDDLHELRSTSALRELELLLMRGPPDMRFVLSSRQSPRLGLHRLRLEAELTEIRAPDLRFTVDEARALFAAADVELSEPALKRLVDRTEGWAAGLRLAALSLAGHSAPERLAAEFSGSDRTVAQYLLAEVLDRQPEDVRHLLLRTSVLGRVSGPLADALTGGVGAERALQELEEANAFVVALDASRSWFRYHHLFGDLLALELRRTAPDDVPALHRTAAAWFEGQGHPVEAIGHAQAAEDWRSAARLLSDHWFGLYLDGESATAHQLLARFPAGAAAADAELTALTAADNLRRGALHEAERYLALAARGSASVPADRRGRFDLILAVLRLQLARQRRDRPAIAAEATRVLTAADAPHGVPLELGEDLRALGLINLAVAELWSDRLDEAQRYLDEGIALAQRIGRPWLELTGRANGALIAIHSSGSLTADRAMQAVELADRHGWGEEPIAGVAYWLLGGAMLVHGQLDEAERWVGRAERVLHLEAEPHATVGLSIFRAWLELASGRFDDALRALRSAERLAGLLVSPFPRSIRAPTLHSLVRMGDLERADELVDELDEQDRTGGEVLSALAALSIARGDPAAASVALAPVLHGSAPFGHPGWRVEGFLLEAIAREALDEAGAVECALETALDLAEPDRFLLPFLVHPSPGLLERHRHTRTAHPALVDEIVDLLAGTQASQRDRSERLSEPLTKSEIRVLRYLPTNLSQPEIAGELGVSLNTVGTHLRHLYAKLGAHRRGEAVERARHLGLLAPSSRQR